MITHFVNIARLTIVTFAGIAVSWTILILYLTFAFPKNLRLCLLQKCC